MDDVKKFPIEALIALVERGTVIMRADLARYGELQYDPRDPALQELDKRLEQTLEKNTT